MTVKTTIHGKLSKLFSKFSDDLYLHHEKELKPVEKSRQDMVKIYRDQRNQLLTMQKERWWGEELKRSARIRSGFKGLWDKINGRYWKNRKTNERETWFAYQREQKEREELFRKQMLERQNLQIQVNLLRKKQDKERKALTLELSHGNSLDEPKNVKAKEKARVKMPAKKTDHQTDFEFDDLDIDMDFEPEI